MADGALARFGADTALSITGDRRAREAAREEKPVGYVCWCAQAGRRLDAGARRPPARRPRRGPRPLDHGGHAPAAAPAAWRRAVLLSGRPGPLFVALDLPEAARTGRAPGAERWPATGLRPVAAESLHVTLVFLGWQDEAAAERIAAAAFAGSDGSRAAAAAPGDVRPVPPRRPRLFALDLEDAGGRCAQLQAAVSRALAAEGFYKPEKRPFWPHVTLARVKRGAPRRRSPELAPPAEPFEATALTSTAPRCGRRAPSTSRCASAVERCLRSRCPTRPCGTTRSRCAAWRSRATFPRSPPTAGPRDPALDQRARRLRPEERPGLRQATSSRSGSRAGARRWPSASELDGAVGITDVQLARPPRRAAATGSRAVAPRRRDWPARAVRLLSAWALSRRRLERLDLYASPDNERLPAGGRDARGFTREGLLRKLRYRARRAGGPVRLTRRLAQDRLRGARSRPTALLRCKSQNFVGEAHGQGTGEGREGP